MQLVDCILCCGRFGVIFGRFGLWPSLCMAVLVVAVLVYGCFGRHPEIKSGASRAESIFLGDRL